MANSPKIELPMSNTAVSKLNLTPLRRYTTKISDAYRKVLDGEIIVCQRCLQPKGKLSFFTNRYNKSKREPYCAECYKKMACDYDEDRNSYRDNKIKTQQVLRLIDAPYLEDYYNKCVQGLEDKSERSKTDVGWDMYIKSIKSLPHYQKLTWEDSDFGSESIDAEEDTKEIKKTVKAGVKRFGTGFTNQDYMFLETQYQDWVTRYECNTKAQEELFERLSFKKWEIAKATKNGDNTKDLDKSYMDLLNTANITPRQQIVDSNSSAQTLGTLIQRWEEERPLPDIDPELQDVDKIGMYIDTFFKGHMAKMLDLKNPLSHLYEKFMGKYTVTPPQYDEDGDSELIFEKIFGSSEV